MPVFKVLSYLLLIAIFIVEISFYALIKTSNLYYLLSAAAADAAIIIIIYSILTGKDAKKGTGVNYYIYVNIASYSADQNSFPLPVKRRDL